MNLERLTQKSQQAVQAAQSIAARYGQVEVDGEHLLLALLRQDGGLAGRLFTKMDVPLEPLAKRLERDIERLPRVSGGGAEPGKVYVSQRFQQLMVKAED